MSSPLHIVTVLLRTMTISFGIAIALFSWEEPTYSGHTHGYQSGRGDISLLGLFAVALLYYLGCGSTTSGTCWLPGRLVSHIEESGYFRCSLQAEDATPQSVALAIPPKPLALPTSKVYNHEIDGQPSATDSTLSLESAPLFCSHGFAWPVDFDAAVGCCHFAQCLRMRSAIVSTIKINVNGIPNCIILVGFES